VAHKIREPDTLMLEFVTTGFLTWITGHNEEHNNEMLYSNIPS
jgi:hypothetical protein